MSLALGALLLLAASAAAPVASAQSGRSIYNKYSDGEGVTAVYVSPAMFKLVGHLPELDIEGKEGAKMDLSSLVRQLTGFYLISTKEPEVAESLYKDAQSFTEKGIYEILMEFKENGLATRMYSVTDKKDPNLLTSFVMLAKDRDETTFLVLEGSMDKAELMKMVSDVAVE